MFNNVPYILNLGPRNSNSETSQKEGKTQCKLSGEIRFTKLCPRINKRGFNGPMNILNTNKKNCSKNILLYVHIVKTVIYNK